MITQTAFHEVPCFNFTWNIICREVYCGFPEPLKANNEIFLSLGFPINPS